MTNPIEQEFARVAVLQRVATLADNYRIKKHEYDIAKKQLEQVAREAYDLGVYQNEIMRSSNLTRAFVRNLLGL